MDNQKEKFYTLSFDNSKFLHVAFWFITFLFYLTPHFFPEYERATVMEVPLQERSIRIIFRLSAIMVCSYFITYRILPNFSDNRKKIKAVIEFILGVYLICVVSRFSVIYMLEPLQNLGKGKQETIFEIFSQTRTLFLHYFIGIFTGSFPFLFLYQFLDRQRLYQKQMKMESEKNASELAALKAQLNPHFLFNTLNNLYSLAVQKSPLAAVSIEKLSNILDYLLYQCNEKYVKIKQEMDLLNNYISLEKLRYNERLEVETDFKTDLNYSIAPLILLSIVENMFKHGVEKTIGKASLKIKIIASNGHFSLITENTFDQMSKSEQGIGLKNIQQQLQLIYPGNHSFVINENGSLFITQLKIKFP